MIEALRPLAQMFESFHRPKASEPVVAEPDYTNWDVSNPCFHCGQCCRNVTLGLSTVGNKKDMFGELYRYVKNPDNPYTSLEHVPREPGVYFVVGKRGYYLSIRGSCPELQKDRSCGIHDKARPRGCVTSGLNSIKRITSRIR